MHLVNFPKVRIKKYDQGYSPEIQKTTWYGKTYWVHIISVSGIDNLPWYYKNKEDAINAVLKYIDWDINYYSNN
jgi:hypothetical protein